jgi:hypothetical protein
MLPSFAAQLLQIEEFFRMRKLLPSGLVLVAGMLAPPSAVAPHARERPADYRFQKLKAFFEKSDCPASNYTQAFLDAADRYDLDWRLLPSLSYIESTGGKAARNNNLFGWDSGRAEFPSPVAGILEVGNRLANSSLYRDKDLDELLSTYNPSEDYARKVKSVMRRIGPE